MERIAKCVTKTLEENKEEILLAVAGIVVPRVVAFAKDFLQRKDNKGREQEIIDVEIIEEVPSIKK